MASRYQLQLWEPDKGGWRTVLTASNLEQLRQPARILHWQTQRTVKFVGPEGTVSYEPPDYVRRVDRG